MADQLWVLTDLVFRVTGFHPTLWIFVRKILLGAISTGRQNDLKLNVKYYDMMFGSCQIPIKRHILE